MGPPRRYAFTSWVGPRAPVIRSRLSEHRFSMQVIIARDPEDSETAPAHRQASRGSQFAAILKG